MNRFEKAAEFGAMMGKVAADTWTASNAGDWLPKGNQVAQQPRLL
jgi:roadblock/LC7 domain-containing protein